jgi:hypothetical protein
MFASRPHTPAPVVERRFTLQEMIQSEKDCEERVRIEQEQAARTATLEILTKLERIDKDTTDYAEFEGKVMELIESLRSTAQEQQR